MSFPPPLIILAGIWKRLFDSSSPNVVSILVLVAHLLLLQVTRDRYIKIKSSAGEAGVVAFDIMATNGVVHIVNSVF